MAAACHYQYWLIKRQPESAKLLSVGRCICCVRHGCDIGEFLIEIGLRHYSPSRVNCFP
jgi:hypothetical protein